MRKISRFILFIAMVLCLGGCDFIITSSSQTSSSSTQNTSSQTSSASTNSNSSNSASSSSSLNSSSQIDKLCILTLNDLHGAVEASDTVPGISRVATYIEAQRSTYGADNVIVIDSGDSFQGTITSNLTEGKVIIDCYNEIGIDQMAIGNHEFDWGIEKLTQYCDGNIDNGEANFPIASANIINKITQELLPGVKEYTIVNKAGLKVGIISTIGYGLESSILTSRVKDYSFHEPVEIIKNLAKKLRSEENCDIIIVNSHDSGEYINSQIAKFNSDSWVDAISNGHTHAEDEELISRNGGVALPAVEAGTNGVNLGKIELTIKNKKVTNAKTDLISISLTAKQESKVESVVQQSVSSIANIKNQVLGTVGQSIKYKSNLYTWAGEVIRKSQNVDVAITNQGGLRNIDGGFNSGDTITLGHLYSIMPFDNQLMYTEVKGSILKTWIDNYNSSNIISYRSGLSASLLEADSTYKVCIIDFMAEKYYSVSTFQNSTYRTTGYLFRDMMIKDIQLQQSTYGNWMPSRGAIITNNDII